MNNNSAVADYDIESESAQLVSDDTQNTDFTQIACCAFGGEATEQPNAKAQSDSILDKIAVQEESSGSIKHFLSRILGSK